MVVEGDHGSVSHVTVERMRADPLGAEQWGRQTSTLLSSALDGYNKSSAQFHGSMRPGHSSVQGCDQVVLTGGLATRGRGGTSEQECYHSEKTYKGC